MEVTLPVPIVYPMQKIPGPTERSVFAILEERDSGFF
jgi:hypothetical protein